MLPLGVKTNEVGLGKNLLDRTDMVEEVFVFEEVSVNEVTLAEYNVWQSIRLGYLVSVAGGLCSSLGFGVSKAKIMDRRYEKEPSQESTSFMKLAF